MTSPVSQADTKSISDAIAKLRSLSQVDILSSWRCYEGDLSATEVIASDLSSWNFTELNAKGQIAWAGGQKVLWLLQKLVIPHDLQGYPLEGLSLQLALVWWADSAKVYVNGQLMIEGDLFDSFPRVLLSRSVTPGEELTVALRLVSPGHCDGALVKSLLVYESNNDSVEPGFVADELAVVQRCLECFEPERLDALRAFVEELDWERLNCEGAEEERRIEFEELLSVIRQKLLEFKICLGKFASEGNQRQSPTAGDPPAGLSPPDNFPQNPKSKIFLLGHAHLDLAWLWRVSETWQAAQKTFESVLTLQQDFPELIFCHSTPALYAWIEEHRPDLFGAIQQAVADGRWEVVGGFWVEPELNLIAGESIVRQLLYGQHYVLEKFGRFSTVVWVPDSFGFCATLPQFLVSAGVEYFVTQKLRWNDTNQFEYGAFWWKSPDGSEVFSYMSALIGEGIDPVKIVSYACEWQSQTRLVESLWLPGVGDHGGGPTRDMLETARRWQKSPVFPNVEFCTSESYLQQIKAKGDIPTWEDELYLEFHRGCYTTHGDQKRWNRYCEGLLYQAELFAAWATLSIGASYPKGELESSWKHLLFNQFHDILPGSSIQEVYVDALPTWQEVEGVGSKILQQSLNAIGSQITLPPPPQPQAQPVVVFNSLNWVRSHVVKLEFPEEDEGQNQNWTMYNLDGHEIESQSRFIGFRRELNGDEIPVNSILFFASEIPACGYRVFWLCPRKPTLKSLKPFEEFVLENECLRVTIDSETGDLSSVFDKIARREVLSGLGNQLQAFQDSGQYWDAWNIDPNYAQHPLPPAELLSVHHLERGTLRTCVRVVRRIGQSTFSQDYILEKESAVLKIANKVNWQENHVLVKVAFPLNLEADFATYEIPCGAIRRTTKPTTATEKAKWEVPALRWADLTEIGGADARGRTQMEEENISVHQRPSAVKYSYGVSLLNDCKYGYDSQPSQLRLTLLRSPKWPNPEADRGYHEFTYALYPHADTWETAHTVRRGYELNIPLQVLVVNPQQQNSQGSLPAIGSLLNISDDNLILMAFKQSEEVPEQWILRCYECHGKTAELHLQSDFGLTLGESVDLLERSVNSSEQQSSTVNPWKIISRFCTRT
ncbi:alpha-mannosidase [Scytonema sp. NUACC26]|uniref:alpha-mannosidase n=1 Tax=Scytonema sp. NUACC26 TaxID=3140176 RepID=UPI0034DCA0D1